MSIHPLAASISRSEAYIGLIAGGVGLIVAWALGAFRRRSIAGARRTRFDLDFATVLWGVGFVAFGAWLFVPALYVTLAYRPTILTTQPAVPSTTTTAPNDRAPMPEILPPRDRVVLGALAQLIGLAVLIAGDRAMLGTRAQRLGGTFRDMRRGFVIGLIGACAAIPLTVAASLLFQWLSMRAGLHVEDHTLISLFRAERQTNIPLLIALAAILVAPMFEEFLFRGHLQTALLVTLRMIDVRPPTVEATWPRWTAIVLAAAVFAAVHGSMWMFFPLMLLAMCCGYVYERTGNLWAPITMHAAFNAVSIALVAANA